MKLSSCIVLRPLCFLIFLMLVVLSLAGLLIPLGINRVKKIEKEVKVISSKSNEERLHGIQRPATFFAPFNASATNLVRSLSSSIDENDLPFSKIQSKVASTLFQALITIPYLSEISYIGLNGLFFGYYTKEDQLFALYSNSTYSPTQNDKENQTWYIHPANRDTGKLSGEAIPSTPYAGVANSSWFLSSLNSTNGYASVGPGLENSTDIMLLNTATVNKRGVVSLALPIKSLINYLVTEVDFYNGSLYLATMDGDVIAQGIPNTRMILNGNKVSIQLLGPNDDKVEIGNIVCRSEEGVLRDSVFNIRDKKYVINCSPVEIAGLELVYVLVQPHNELSSLIEMIIKMAFLLLILMISAIIITMFTFLYLIVGATRKQMHLCGALIKQMEATQQAERKSMNKSLAFASASHDIRASLAGITGHIERCLNEVSRRDPTRSELQTNLHQMEDCTKDLLGILNSILDTSKIEAGKMQLAEEEFDIEQLLEDVVDLFHPVGAKKGVDVILDPHDGSIAKSSGVKGDRGKLKQILCNLLSNAIKFTSEGHVTVRAWARKPTIENEILASSRNHSMRCIFWLFSRVDKNYIESEVVNTIQRDPNCMEFLFEVNDTGKGIPKEKRKSVFEDYVQVKETAIGQEGTGLGLGIVQSLVRLMGGEIGIVDKEVGERGTCFKFNVFLRACETHISTNNTKTDIEASNGDYILSDSFHSSGPNPIIRNNSPKVEGSRVILYIHSPKRSRIVQNFMERLGIKVYIVNQQEQLSPTLKKIKHKLNLSHHSSSSKSDLNSRSDGCISRASSTRSKEVPLSALDGSDNILPSQRNKPNSRGGSFGFVLIMIDMGLSPFRDISRAVAEFRRDLDNNCSSRVIWLDNPMGVSTSNFQGLDEYKLPPSDLVMSKPLHGSRLYQAIGFLPEFRTMTPPRKLESNVSNNVCSIEASTSGGKGKAHELSFANKMGEIKEIEGPSSNKPLSGKKILVADDNRSARTIAASIFKQLGVDSIFPCENGEEALRLVCKSLDDGTNGGASKGFVPFDCILMDCQMPVMDGIEATRRIREVERNYGVHIPIMGLTAHEKGDEEMNMMIQAGVDVCLTKPLNAKKFLEALSQQTVRT